MTAGALPDVVDGGVAIFIFAVGVGMVAVHTALVALAARHTTPALRRPHLLPGLAGAYLATWFAVAMAVGNLATGASESDGPRLWLSFLVAFVPMALAITLLFASKAVRAVNAAMPAHWLIWAQTYRVAGLMFLFPFLYYGVVPAAFAVPAGLGDAATGLLAPLVGRAVARGRPHAIRWAVAWNVFGVLDLIVAPAAAILSQAQVLDVYPMSLVPLFIGPPLGILTHVYSLRNIAVLSSRVPDAARRPAGTPRATSSGGTLETA